MIISIVYLNRLKNIIGSSKRSNFLESTCNANFVPNLKCFYILRANCIDITVSSIFPDIIHRDHRLDVGPNEVKFTGEASFRGYYLADYTLLGTFWFAYLSYTVIPCQIAQGPDTGYLTPSAYLMRHIIEL